MIKPNDVVTLHYAVSTHDGTLLDSSRDGEPMQVLLGSKFLIEGLEEAIIGRSAGDTFEVTVSAAKAYGARVDELVQSVPKSMFEGIDVESGMSFRATTDQGEQSVIVIEVDDENVVVDGNHPLSGMDLTFDVEIFTARDATEDEIARGEPDTGEKDKNCGCC